MGSVTVYRLEGRITGGAPLDQLSTAIKEETAQGRRLHVLDLGEVRFINSTGLGIIISMSFGLHKTGGHLCLADPSGRVEELFRIVTYNMDGLPVYDSVEEAASHLESLAQEL
jgi:anti-sigma B factor antagonist